MFKNGEILVSDHGYDKMVEDRIIAKDIISSIEGSELNE